jgi:chaperone required for assembly of F1-ATPase
MRDKLTDTWFPTGDNGAADPVKTVQAGLKPALPKRFYERASTEERDGTFVLLLDGRTAKTPARNLLAVPTRALGQAVAEEWARQPEVIDPTAMPLTRIVNSAIDGVAPRREEVIDDLARYAGSDLVCYRAAEPERLVAQEAAAWDPILAWAAERLGARFILSEGAAMRMVRGSA